MNKNHRETFATVIYKKAEMSDRGYNAEFVFVPKGPTEKTLTSKEHPFKGD